MVVGDLKNTKSRVNISLREVMHMQKRNPLFHLHKILHVVEIPTQSLMQIMVTSIKGFGADGSQILPFSIDFYRRSYNTVALPGECVISGKIQHILPMNLNTVIGRHT